MRLSTRIRRNFESLSFRFLSRCFRMETAFLMRQYMSSGRDGARPLVFRMRRILLPVTVFTCGTPKLSRSVTPICEGVRPFLASFAMWSLTSSGFIFSQEGGLRRYGVAEELMPLPAPYMRPMASTHCRGDQSGNTWL